MATVSYNYIVCKKITVANSTGAMPLRLRGTHPPETLGEPAAEFFVDKLRNNAFLHVREPTGTAWDATQIWNLRVYFMDASENSSGLGQKRLGKRVAHLTGDPPFQDDRSTVNRCNKVALDSRNNLRCRNSQSEHGFRVRREPPRT